MKDKVALTLLAIAIIALAVFLCLTLSAFAVSISRSSYVPPVSEYPYSIGANNGTATQVIFCKTFDAEARVARMCIVGNPDFLGFKVDEYHLGVLDNWVLR